MVSYLESLTAPKRATASPAIAQPAPITRPSYTAGFAQPQT